MNKAKALKTLNPILFLVLVYQVAIGFSHDLLPRKVFWYMHLVGAILLIAAVCLHLFLNWSWIRANLLK